MTTRVRTTTICCSGILAVSILGMCAMLPPGALAAGTSEEPAAEKPLLFFSYWGFGDFQGKPCAAEGGGKVLPIPQGHTMGTWSGCSKEWKGEALDTQGFNAITVEVEGADTIAFPPQHDQKMMKWAVRWPGQTQDRALIGADPDLHSASDPEWVVPVDGKHDYPLPPDAVTAGKLTKIGFTLLEGATYGNVRIKAWLRKR
jgi:hypothetical protein